MKPSIYGLTKESLSLWMTEQEEKKFRTNQVWEWLYEKRVATFEEMTNLPKSLVTKLNESSGIWYVSLCDDTSRL